MLGQTERKNQRRNMTEAPDQMTQHEDTPPTNARMVVAALMTGAALKARDVAEAVSRTAGREVSPASVSGILSRISDPSRSDLGNFIRKHKDANAWVYTMALAAQALSEEQAYDLTQKTGAGRYTLIQALRDYPGLQKEIAPTAAPKGQKPAFRIMRKMADTVRPKRRIDFKSRKDRSPSDHTIELSIQYSNRYTLSIASSLKTFILLCLAAVLTVGACCLVMYAFFFPAAVLAAMAAAGWLGWRYLQSARSLR
jgi:predicted transcriptional regulator